MNIKNIKRAKDIKELIGYIDELSLVQKKERPYYPSDIICLVHLMRTVDKDKTARLFSLLKEFKQEYLEEVSKL